MKQFQPGALYGYQLPIHLGLSLNHTKVIWVSLIILIIEALLVQIMPP